MQTTPVASTTLARIAYDPSRQLLHLEFRDRTVYQYLGVPADLHQALLHSRSKGQYFNRAIRGHFPYASAPALGDFLS
jgi:hypothetical protein